MIQRQGTITHASTTSDPVLCRDHVIRDIKVKLCFSNVPIQEFDVPKSYHYPAHLSNEQFTFNFDLEKKVLEQAKNSLLSIEGELSANQARQHPFLQNGVSAMLIPDRVDSALKTIPTHVDNQALTQTVREFEGDNNDPFEMVQLQTIDDMAELQSVLQPNSTPGTPVTTSQSTPYPPIATVAMTSHDAPLVDLSDNTVNHSEFPVNTDTTRQRPQVPPRHHIPTHTAVTTHSNDITPPVPKPRVRSVSPQKEVASKPVAATGVRVLPPLTSSNPLTPQLPSYSNVPAAITTKAPVLPSYEAAVSSQPPPKPQPTPTVTTDTYRLPDPTGSLGPKELELVSQMASMGFPKPRLARAAKRLKDSAKVLDFLVTIGGLEEQYHLDGDSIETALLASDDDPTKATKYLDKVQSYKELGFSEKKIHAAYEKAKKDWDKTIDILLAGDT